MRERVISLENTVLKQCVIEKEQNDGHGVMAWGIASLLLLRVFLLLLRCFPRFELLRQRDALGFQLPL